MSHSPLRRLFPTFQADLRTKRQTRRQLRLRLTDIRAYWTN
jgi:hypothetical protein